MLTYRYNGEYWVADKRSIIHRIRQWFVWFGGWENCITGKWEPFGQSNYFKRWWNPLGIYLRSPAPLSLFNHRATYYGWGFQVKLKSGYFVMSWNNNNGGLSAYISHNGTPTDAHHWIINPPNKVVFAAFEAIRKKAEREAYFKEQMEKAKQDFPEPVYAPYMPKFTTEVFPQEGQSNNE